MPSEAEKWRGAYREFAAKYENTRLELEEYAEHQNWRCGHPDRWPWNPDCQCGLTKVLRKHHLPFDMPQKEE